MRKIFGKKKHKMSIVEVRIPSPHLSPPYYSLPSRVPTCARKVHRKSGRSPFPPPPPPRRKTGINRLPADNTTQHMGGNHRIHEIHNKYFGKNFLRTNAIKIKLLLSNYDY